MNLSLLVLTGRRVTEDRKKWGICAVFYTSEAVFVLEARSSAHDTHDAVSHILTEEKRK